MIGSCGSPEEGTIARQYHEVEKIFRKYDRREGHTHKFPEREKCLTELTNRPEVKRIAEIGFNAGHSTVTLLFSNEDAELWSFDLCVHEYYEEAVAYIKKEYEGRFHIICGDSQDTVPRFLEDNPDIKFDLIHIDGGHSGDIPKNDIINMAKLSHENTFILVDDCNRVEEHRGEDSIAEDVNRAWDDCIENDIIQEWRLEGCNYGNCLAKLAAR